MRIFKNQRGDTIMEVLIAVAVLSLILTVSLALANRNTQGNRQAQERGEATKHTESQIELLKSYLASSANPVLPPNGNFCMKDDGTPSDPIEGIVDETQEENFGAFNGRDECKKGEFYHVYINRAGDTFTAHTRWVKVAGRGIDEATMVHRIYPEIAAKSASVGTVSQGCAKDHYEKSLGGCEPCPPGMGSLGGTVTLADCTEVGSTMRVEVKKINPVNDVTPNCGMAATANKANIPVSLSRAGGVLQGSTNGSSIASFGGLPTNTLYTLTVNNPADYGVCPPASKQVRTGDRGTATGVGSTTEEKGFKVYPICKETVTHHYNSVPQYTTTYWWVWQHYPQSPLQNLGYVPYPVFGSGPNTFGSSAPPAANWAGWTAYEPYHVHTNHGHYFYNRFVSEQRSSTVLTGYISVYSHSTTVRSCPS